MAFLATGGKEFDRTTERPTWTVYGVPIARIPTREAGSGGNYFWENFADQAEFPPKRAADQRSLMRSWLPKAVHSCQTW